MKVFDFNIHLPILDQESIHSTVNNELKLSVENVKSALIHYDKDLKLLSGYNIMLFNEQIVAEGEKIQEIQTCIKAGSTLSLLFDFRAEKWKENLEVAIEVGIKFIKFHSYHQQIAEQDFFAAIEVAKYASDKGLGICIDASYGSIDMYRFDNLKLTCEIARVVSSTPIIILHSGGARVLDAMLIAHERKNVFLETSFSLPYYRNSSIEKDLAFAYKKIGAEKVIYGSDFPYVGISESIKIHQQFFHKYNFRDKEISQIMEGNVIQNFCK